MRGLRRVAIVKSNRVEKTMDRVQGKLVLDRMSEFLRSSLSLVATEREIDLKTTMRIRLDKC